MELTLEQLQPFCSTDQTILAAKPFISDQETYATDGIVLIRVREYLFGTGTSIQMTGMFSFSMLRHPPTVDIIPIEITDEAVSDDANHRDPCPICEGTGTIICTGCDREEDCKSCAGGGSFERHPLIKIPLAGWFMKHHLRAMLAVEPTEISICRDVSTPVGCPLYFKGDNFDGFCRPVASTKGGE